MLYRAREGGCPNCLNAGYKGRTAIYELLMIDEQIRQLAIKNADAGTIKRAPSRAAACAPCARTARRRFSPA